MVFRNILFALVAETGDAPEAAMAAALALAQHGGAHLSAAIGALKVPVNVPFGGSYQAMVNKENSDRVGVAEALGQAFEQRGRLNGLTTQAQVIAGALEPMLAGLVHQARLHDLTVIARPQADANQSWKLAETLLFESGRPLLLVPDGAAPRAFKRLMVAWDGTANAARALAMAMPLLGGAEALELVCVRGEKDLGDEVKAADLAPLLVHHVADVTVSDLHTGGRGVAATLLDHAGAAKADALIMGAYAHSRFRQMVWGGATRDMLGAANLPVLMAH